MFEVKTRRGRANSPCALNWRQLPFSRHLSVRDIARQADLAFALKLHSSSLISASSCPRGNLASASAPADIAADQADRTPESCSVTEVTACEREGLPVWKGQGVSGKRK